MMDLPSELELSFRSTIDEIEKEKKMPYVTSIERIAKEEGRQEGRQEGHWWKVQSIDELPARLSGR